MTDYGHDLRFGTFLSPDTAHPDSVVAAVLASETAGLDIATFQDHPYQPGFLDTWTLMAFVAARTTSIGRGTRWHASRWVDKTLSMDDDQR